VSSGRPPPPPGDAKKRARPLRLGEPFHEVEAADPREPPVAVDEDDLMQSALREEPADAPVENAADQADARQPPAGSPSPALDGDAAPIAKDEAPWSTVGARADARVRPRADRLRALAAAAALVAVAAFFTPAFIDAIAGDPSARARLRPAPVDRSLSLAVRSTPAHAVVTVDGAERGKTPLLVNVTCSGDVAVTVEAPGYQPWRASVPCAAGDARALDARLSPIR